MTIFGKILVFINLIFSLLVGGLVVAVYIARTNYAVEYDNTRKKLEVSVKNAEQALAARNKAEVDLDNAIKEAESKLKASNDLLQTKVQELDRVNQMVSEDRKKVESFDAALKSAQLEVERRQADVTKLRDTLKAETDNNFMLVKDNNALKDNATASQLQAAALVDRNKQLVDQLEDMGRNLARANKAGGATPATGGMGSRTSSKNPPNEHVEGLVKATDATGLVTITIGSDAGLARGHTLEVFRLDSTPSRSKYLGTLRIEAVTATEAVGQLQPAGRNASPVQPGDRVASRILGS